MCLGIWFSLLITGVSYLFLPALLIRIYFYSAMNASEMLLFLAVYLSLAEVKVCNVCSVLTLNHR